jgi:putative nucleotide binding protein
MSDSESDEAIRRAVVLDYLPHGRSDDDRPQYRRSAVGYGVDTEDFRLYEFAISEDGDASIGDDIAVEPADAWEQVDHVREIEYDDLSSGARSELDYVIDDLLEDEETRFVDVYNEAGPVTLRLHQLNLLPGIGDKLRDSILEERKRRGPFEDFEDVGERVDGLHDPEDVIRERILEEIQGEDLKYRLFARRESE